MFIAYSHASSQATVLLTFHSTIILAYDDDFHEQKFAISRLEVMKWALDFIAVFVWRFEHNL